MRTTNLTARGIPLAVLLLTLACLSWAVLGEGTLRVDQTISPSEIYVIGSDEEPSSAMLTLTVATTGSQTEYPIDCLFVIDVSATSDILQAKQFVSDLIDQLGVNDRAGLISYGTTAQLEMPLTHNLGAVKLALASLASGGKSAMGLGMQMARNEFEQAGRDDAIFVEVLLSDGQSSIGPEPDTEGAAAERAGIRIMTVGLGTLINRTMLQEFASQTSGKFFESPTDRARTDIFSGLDAYVAAGDLRVEKRIPNGLRYIDSTPAPTQVEVRPEGTTIIWRLGDLELGESKRIDVELEAISIGEFATDKDSQIRFNDFRGVAQAVDIAPLRVSGIHPYVQPEPEISATRSIMTCLPGDQTIPNGVVELSLLVKITAGIINGLAVVEQIPAGWTFIEGENDTGTVRQNGNTLEWLFVQKLGGETVDTQREIRYSLKAPASVTSSSGVQEVAIQGTISSSSPRLNQPVLGEDKISLTQYLPIPIVISRLDTDAATPTIQLCEADPEIIDFAEIQLAVAMWYGGDPVPQTNNQTISISMMQDLIAYWLTGRSVHDSLP
jgi:hypothetical protein